jgi:DNA-binding transcriptional LysR family regulator
MRYPRVDMEGLAAIVAVAEAGNIVKAGELLNIDPSAVLKRLSKAQTTLLTKLFRRTRDRIAMTTDGRTYCQEGSYAIERSVLAEEKVTAAIRLRKKRLLVGHSTYLPSRLLAILARLNNEGIPGMTAEQISGLGHEIERGGRKRNWNERLRIRMHR